MYSSGKTKLAYLFTVLHDSYFVSQDTLFTEMLISSRVAVFPRYEIIEPFSTRVIVKSIRTY